MWMPKHTEIQQLTQEALKAFWGVRTNGVLSGQTMDGFANMLKQVLRRNGVADDEIIMGRSAKLPGYFRMSKDWDMVVIKNLSDGSKRLLAVIEFKSMHGSVGNNLNNRSEEAVGSSYDFWKAFENGAFGATRPFLGYIYVMSDHPDNKSGTSRVSMLFAPLEEYTRFFRTGRPANYEERVELLMMKMVQEKLYDKCALLIADQKNNGGYRTPNKDLSIEIFVRSLVGHVAAHQN
ncbi:PaeR7I family type II restriction endonuclease [Brevibacillus borstelensis]|uniref:PaeR7I family type II restriction endonuclease n=1 Tax=Brevibacillus TaxID=55080 RepID=UPI001D147C2C|nr:PaeR7I family type II restriction endonuclease [Brevibacillus borstelensis]WNF06414.1 PaeR7I family type II restriction endonuclease [Brevibacillus borstelensis]